MYLEGKNKKLGDDVKIGWIGFRASDKYDGSSLWGIEYRAIDRGNYDHQMREFMNALQFSMLTDNFVLENFPKKYIAIPEGTRDDKSGTSTW